jgi:predicted histidine transporter YuiF (NhaC family)
MFKVYIEQKKQERWWVPLLAKMTVSPSRIISYKNKKKQLWDFTILFLAIMNSLIVPVELAFDPELVR